MLTTPPHPRRLIPLAALFALSACHGNGLTDAGDLSARDDLGPSWDLSMAPAGDLGDRGDLGGFCSNPQSPRIELNGMLAASPAVSATLLVLNCCDAAGLDFASMQISTSIALMWRHQVGQGPNPPVTLDLAHLPAGWSVSVVSDCSIAQPNCQPRDRWDAGLAGTLTISPKGGGFQMSACLTASETAQNPHPVIHTLRLYTPTITTH